MLLLIVVSWAMWRTTLGQLSVLHIEPNSQYWATRCGCLMSAFCGLLPGCKICLRSCIKDVMHPTAYSATQSDNAWLLQWTLSGLLTPSEKAATLVLVYTKRQGQSEKKRKVYAIRCQNGASVPNSSSRKWKLTTRWCQCKRCDWHTQVWGCLLCCAVALRWHKKQLGLCIVHEEFEFILPCMK